MSMRSSVNVTFDTSVGRKNCLFLIWVQFRPLFKGSPPCHALVANRHSTRPRGELKARKPTNWRFPLGNRQFVDFLAFKSPGLVEGRLVCTRFIRTPYKTCHSSSYRSGRTSAKKPNTCKTYHFSRN